MRDGDHQGHGSPPTPDGGIWSPSRRPLTVGLILTVTLVALEALAVATVMPEVRADLGGYDLYGWVFSGFFLASIVGIVVGGPAADRRGLVVPFTAGLVLFAAGLAVACGFLGWLMFDPKKAMAGAGLAMGSWLILGALAEWADRVRLFRAPGAETLRRARGLPLASWGMMFAHAGLGVFVLGAVAETAFKAEAALALSTGQSVAAGGWVARLDDVKIVEGPNYLAERGTLTVTRADGAAPRVVTAERRFFPTGGQTTTEVGLDFRGLDDVYVVLGERRAGRDGRPAWTVRLYWNPWARLIFLGPAIMALGGLLSLMDRRLRLGVGARRKAKA